jgi:hypothetical protein
MSWMTDLILAYFQLGFGVTPDIRSSRPRHCASSPDDRADGVRWDNRENWDTDDLPGSVSGDSVNLAGNWVTFGGNAEIRNLECW